MHPEVSSQLNEYHRLEINEIFERTRGIENLRFQAGTLVGTASITIVGFAFTLQKAGLLLIAAAVMALLIALDLLGSSYLRRVYQRGLQLEQLYAPDAVNALVHTLRPSYNHHGKSVRRFSIAGFWLPVIIIGFLLIISINLWYQGWQWF